MHAFYLLNALLALVLPSACLLDYWPYAARYVCFLGVLWLVGLLFCFSLQVSVFIAHLPLGEHTFCVFNGLLGYRLPFFACLPAYWPSAALCACFLCV